MKKFNLFKMLAVLIVLITSINTAWGDTKTIYLVPGVWIYDGTETYWVHAWGSKEEDVQLTQVDGQTGIYQATVTSGNTQYKFTRNRSNSTGPWSEKMDQTDDISDASHNCCEITGWEDANYSMCDIDLSATTTVYYTYTGSSTLKVNVNLCGTAGVWRLINMTNTGKTYDGKAMYSAEIPVYFGGLKDLQFVEGDSYLSKFNTWTSTSVFGGKIYYSNKWKNMGIKRTYDGNTYIYWKISGNDIPGTWDDSGSGSHAIQMLSISNGNYVYTGFNSGEELEGSNFVRYLVPAGDYADCLELRDKNNNYSSEYGFPAESEDNEIWNFKTDGSKIQWAQTYFAKDAYVYFDNTNSSWSTASGYNYLLAGGGGYSALYDMSPISDTKLLCHTSSWSYNDFLQLVFIHTGNEWTGTDGDPNNRKTSADYRTASLPKLMDHSSNLYNLYIPSDAGAKASSEASLSHSSNSGYAALLHSTQTVNIEITRDNGSSWITAPKAPAKVTLHSFALTDETTSAASNATDIAVDATTVETSTTAVRTATTTVAYSNKKDGYTFIGWYKNGSSQGSGTSVVYYPTGATTHTARFRAHRYNIAFNANSTRFPGATGSMDPINNVACDVNQTLTANGFTRTGYAFAGWATTSNGDKAFDNEESVSNLTYEDGTTVTLFALWEPVALEFKGTTNSNWNTASNWDPACVPTSGHDVTISAAVTVDDEETVAKAKSIVFAGDGSLTIKSTGALEVAGTISNTYSTKLVIESDEDNQGALIYDISKASPYATVNVTTSKTDDDNVQYISSPVGAVSVYPTFAGEGVYTYAWIEGKGWDRRGYYDDFSGNEVIVLNGQAGCTFSGQLYPSTGGSLAFTATPEDEDAQGVNLIPNTLTAPIKIKALSFSGSSDNGVHIWENGAWIDYAPASSRAETAVIPALQGYAVIASSAGSVSFDYTTAVRGASSHNDPLRAPKHTTTDTPDYMTISVTTNERKIDLQLSEHVQFSNGIDKGWETIYMKGDGRFGQLYAQATEKMSILATPDLEGTVLGFTPGQAENYTISFEGDGKGYYLNDVKEEEATLIDESNTYIFAADESTNSTRFVISKTPIKKTPTSVENLNDGVKARKQMIDGALYIIRDGKLYNAEGALVK